MRLTEEQFVAIRAGEIVDPRFAMTVFVVEADLFAQHALWQEWHKFITWEQDNPGWQKTIGHVGDRPVCISIAWVLVNGKYVMFYEATSEIVDFKIVRAWLDKNCAPPHWDGGTRRAHCDALNFHHCMSVIAPDVKRTNTVKDLARELHRFCCKTAEDGPGEGDDMVLGSISARLTAATEGT